MKVGLFITARNGSKRLPDKHLMTINGKKVISILVNRVRNWLQALRDNQTYIIAITTGSYQENRSLGVSIDEKAEIFYGSDQNIPLRHLQAAEHFDVEYIISIDGDDILISLEYITQVLERLKQGNLYVSTSGLPLGLNIAGYSTNFLRKSLSGKKESILETGWHQIFDSHRKNFMNIKGFKKYRMIRATLDYPNDYRFFKRCFTEINDIYLLGSKDLCESIIKNKIYVENCGISDVYWKNFEARKNDQGKTLNE